MKVIGGIAKKIQVQINILGFGMLYLDTLCHIFVRVQIGLITDP